MHKGIAPPPRSSTTGAPPAARRYCTKPNGANAPGYDSYVNVLHENDAGHAPPQGATIQNFLMAYKPNVPASAAAMSTMEQSSLLPLPR